MEYTEEQVIKMMEAYADTVYFLAVHSLLHAKKPSGKAPYLSEDLVRTSFEFFEEDVPENIRDKLKINKVSLEEALKLTFSNLNS